MLCTLKENYSFSSPGVVAGAVQPRHETLPWRNPATALDTPAQGEEMVQPAANGNILSVADR